MVKAVKKRQVLKNSLALGGWRGWFIVVVGAMLYSYQFIIRLSISSMKDDIMMDLMIDVITFGSIAGAYYIGYAFIQVPLGLMMDRLGPRRFMAAAGFFCGAGCFLFVSTKSPYVAGAARVLMGLGAANGFLGTLKLGMLWIPPHHMAKVVALTMIFGTVGAALANAPLSLLVNAIGWEKALQTIGMLGIFLGCLIYVFVRDGPPQKLSKSKRAAAVSPFLGLLQVLKSPQAWLVSMIGMLLFMPVVTLGDAWGKSFLIRVYGMEEAEALAIMTSMFLGIAVGGPFFMGVSDLILQRRLPLILGTIGAIIIQAIIILYTGLPMYFMYGLFFLIGFFYTAKGLCFTIIAECIPDRNAGGVALAFTNSIVNISGVFHPLIGALLVKHWSGTMLDGHPFYTEMDYRFALSIIPLMSFVALLLIFFLRETHPGRHVENRFN